MTVLAIDQGTSATKAMIVDDEGTPLTLCEVAVDVLATADGGVELRPDELWHSVESAATTAWHQAGRPRLDAIGLANQGETVLAWDRRSGAAVSNAIVWQDRRSSVVCDEIARIPGAAAAVHAITGLELDPYFVAPKLAWLRRQLDRLAAHVAITTTDVWLLHRLCGSFTTDIATAGRSLMTSLDDRCWDPWACELFGVDPGTLPRITANDDVLGSCNLFGGGVPVSGACVDQQAALWAEQCRQPGEAKCTYGTGAFLLACTGTQPTRSATGLVGCPAWTIDGQPAWCLDGQVFTVGAAVNWLVDIGVMRSAADLDALGSTVADSGGVTFVPALAGLAAPFWQPTARGAFIGLSLATGPAHMVQAAIEGIACQVALLAQAAATDLGAPITRLRVDGGLTRSATLLQVQADLLQCTVEVFPSPHATALGVAEMAAIGAGQRRHRSPFARAVVGDEASPAGGAHLVEPQIDAAAASERIERWRATAEATLHQ